MNLLDFLSEKNDGRSLAPIKPVTFQVVGEDRTSGAKVRAEARAVLVFVDEAQREDVLADAEKAMRQKYPSGEIPPLSIANEITFQKLVRALRDADSPRRPFADNINQLKSSLMLPVASRLIDDYDDWVSEEFPTSITVEQFEIIVEQATKKFLSGQPSSTDCSRLARVLSGLAGRFEKSGTETSSSGEPAESPQSE